MTAVVSGAVGALDVFVPLFLFWGTLRMWRHPTEGAATGRRPRHIYRRAGRPCPRCGAIIRVEHQGSESPRPDR